MTLVILYVNLLTALLVNISPHAKYFPISKDLFVIIALFFLLLCIQKRNYKILLDKYILLFLLLLSIYFIVTDESFFNRVYNFRRLALPLIIFTLFMNLKLDLKESEIYSRFLTANFLVLVTFGLFEYFNTNFIWKTLIDINLYWNLNATQDSSELDSFTSGGRLFTSDSIAFLGYKLRRMISLSLEPTTFAAFILFCSTLFLYERKYFLYALSIICGFLTFSKLFIVGCILVLFQKLFRLYHPAFLILGTILLFFLSQYISHNTDKLHGSFSHIKGFYSGITLLADHPLGFGIGKAGNRGSLGVSTMNGDYGGESGFGNVTAQVGFLGLLYLLILFFLYRKIYQHRSKLSNQISLSLIIQYLLNFYLSASSMGVLSFFFIFSYLGIHYGRNEH